MRARTFSEEQSTMPQGEDGQSSNDVSVPENRKAEMTDDSQLIYRWLASTDGITRK